MPMSLKHPHHLNWPRTITDKDGAEYSLRPMRESDIDQLKKFFHDIPREDRLFLRYDVDGSSLFDRRLMETLHCDRTLRLLVFQGDEIVGHGLLEPCQHLWSRHVGEVRVIVRKNFRLKSLGSIILRELVDQAEILGYDKLVVRLMDTQRAVRRMCEQTGFTLEAELKNHVKDLDGNKHAMLVLSCGLDEAWHAMEMLLEDIAPWAL